MTPLGIFVSMTVVLVMFGLFYLLLKGVIWLRYNGPTPVRWILAPFTWIILVIGALCAISLARDANRWWNER